MRDFRDAKAIAHTLREALKAKPVSLTHSESLELVAKILGFHDWNELSAQIRSEDRPVALSTTPAPISTRSRLPVVPLRDIVFFPQMIAPILVGRDGSRHAVERAMKGDKRFIAVTQRRATDDNPRQQDLYDVGVTANIIDFTTLGDGTLRVVAKGLARTAMVHLAEGKTLTAEVAALKESSGQEEEASSLMCTVLERFHLYRKLSVPSPLRVRLPHIHELSEFADGIAPSLLTEIDHKQDLLETSDVIVRLKKILALMDAGQQAA
jgi:ATP-dependent Lon protease